MCGLVGIAGNLSFQDEATMKRLLIFDYFRGPDSTGMGTLRKDGSTRLAKAAVNPCDFFEMKSFTDALSASASLVFLGHNRYATKGKINGGNAHPFEYGHILGAHNGTLTEASWKALNELNGVDTDVDSQALILAISNFGIDEVVPLLEGAWALTWIDTKEGTLNFLRNKERPFWYAYEKGYKKIFWASEYPIIRAAVEMSTTKYEYATCDEGYSFRATAEDMHYRIPLEELVKGSDARPTFQVKELKGKEPPPAVTHYSGSPFTGYRGGQTPTIQVVGGTSTKNSLTTTGPSPKVINLTGSTVAPFAGYLSRSKFDALAACGCSWCQKDVGFDEVGVHVDTIYETVLCPTCTGDTTRSRLIVPDFN